MQISISQIVRPINLEDYAPELVRSDGKPLLVWVWVNPTRDMMARRRRQLQVGSDAYKALGQAMDGHEGGRVLTPEERTQILTDLHVTGTEMAAWFAEIWSKHPDPSTHWTVDEVLNLGLSDTDPGLYPWLQRRTLKEISDHRAAEKKRP
ncbi:MAG TPA: hypothetical protein PL117_03220 [Accumulibacter sp.]|uniref:hypothetical protein n=1 Tax=Accumulibacter sp. TaxID=2053492 RepID=UPI002CE8285D|nr:hypothetical protein [Accumulibacter sp.]HRF71758.1 hypothetical protein [Accumulibacter sp.]